LTDPERIQFVAYFGAIKANKIYVTLIPVDRHQFEADLAAIGMALSPHQVGQFEEFEAALYERNRVVNLTRVAVEDCARRHFIDSLLVASFIPQGSMVLDIGTGPGFPSWPLACSRPDLTVTALDSAGKMLGFLETQHLPNLKIVNGRAEELLEREGFDFVTGRAVAPLPIQMELSAYQVRLGGLFVPMRTVTDDPEDVDAGILGLRLEKVVTLAIPGTDVTRLFPVYEKRSLTPKRFPRRWADIKATPLYRLPSRNRID
jgi:16S rRNA (guanine527-N7)-methyltransferase